MLALPRESLVMCGVAVTKFTFTFTFTKIHRRGNRASVSVAPGAFSPCAPICAGRSPSCVPMSATVG